MDEIIAKRIQQNPDLLDVARANLERWLANCSPTLVSTLLEWRSILDAGVDAVTEMLLGTDERCTRLRQSSPFAGEQFISGEERKAILKRFDAYETSGD